MSDVKIIEQRRKVANLVAELDFWVRMSNDLMRAEHVYDEREHDILTLRRRIATVKETIRYDLEWKRHELKKMEEGAGEIHEGA